MKIKIKFKDSKLIKGNDSNDTEKLDEILSQLGIKSDLGGKSFDKKTNKGKFIASNRSQAERYVKKLEDNGYSARNYLDNGAHFVEITIK